jgi:YVTN family beta-propeller protein
VDPAGSVSVINPATNTVIATIGVGDTPDGLAVSPTGDIYVTDQESGTVSVINPTGTVDATIPVDNFPVGVAVSPAGTYAGDVYVADGTVLVIR